MWGKLLYVLERKVGITSSGLIFVALSFVGWFLAYKIGGRVLFLLVYGAGIVLVVSFMLGRRRLLLDVTRSKIPGRVREGQIVNVELQLKSRRRVSTVILEETLHPHLGSTVRVPIPSLPSGEEVTHEYSFAPIVRGVYKVGPLEATWSDPFGLTRKRALLTEPIEIIVHPSTEIVKDRVLSREWEDPPIRPPISKPWPTGFEFYGMREYAPGDDPRRIIWRATARTLDPITHQGQILMKESEQGITDRVSILLDTDLRTHSPGDPSETFETAVRAAASLGTKHLKDGFAVTLEVNGRRMFNQLRGGTKRMQLLDELARVDRERVSLTKSLERMMTTGRGQLHNVVVTPHLGEEATGRLRILIDRGVSMMVALVQWDETDPDSIRRASTLGCNIVEISSSSPLEAAFARVIGAGVRRER